MTQTPVILMKKSIPENFMKNVDVLHQIDILIMGGAQCRIQTTDKMLADEIITELKATGAWARQPVRTWESKIISLDEPKKKVK